VHEDLHPIGSSVGEQVGMMRVGGAEHLNDACQRRFCASAHVDRLSGQPHGVGADQRSHSRSQAAHDDADS